MGNKNKLEGVVDYLTVISIRIKFKIKRNIIGCRGCFLVSPHPTKLFR